MFIVEMFEGAGRRVVVTYPGRFQPFHLGHSDVFQDLQSQYGSDNVYIVTSNKSEPLKSPFSFSDKIKFMHAAGVPDHSIIQTSGRPYDLPDAFQSQKQNIIFIVAVGAPDAARLNPGSIKKDGSASYFQKLPDNFNEAVTADQHGYVIVVPEKAKTISVGGKTVDVSHGTPCRELWNQIRDNPKQRTEFLTQTFGQGSQELGHIMDKISTGAPEPAPKPSPKLKKVKAPAPEMSEGWFDTAKEVATWYLKKDGDVLRTVNGEPFTFKTKQDAINWAMRTYKVSYNQQNIIATTNPDKNLMTPGGATVAEEAAGVGVVKNGKDPRYMTATMGDDNKVTADTLPQMMKNYNLVPGKKKTIEGARERMNRQQQQLRKKSGLPDPGYYKELKQVYDQDLPDPDHAAAVAAVREKYKIKEDASSGATGAGSFATSMGGGAGFGQSIFYSRTPRSKKSRKLK